MNSKRLSECTYGDLKEFFKRSFVKENNVTGGGECYSTPKAFKYNKNRDE